MNVKVTCDACKGVGRVPHEKRRIGPPEAPKVDPWDFQEEEICMKCGGTGKMAGTPPSTS